MKNWRILVALVILPVSAFAGGGTVIKIPLQGMINPATAEWVADGVRFATKKQADLVLLELDTPGGMLQSTRVMVKTLLNSAVPVVVYVAPSGAHAASAGMFITLAADIAAMAPGTNIGASTPIDSSGKDMKEGGRDLARKVMEDTKALVRSITGLRKRNEAWALAAVTEARSYTAEEALQAGAIDMVAKSQGTLLARLAGRTVTTSTGTVVLPSAFGTVEIFAPSIGQKFLRWLAHPQVAYLLMMVGMAGLYFELSTPGAIFPGVLGGISLLLAFASLNILPFNVSGLALIALALVLMVLEAFVPSGGLLGVGGVLSFVFGSLLIFDRPDLDVGINVWTIAMVSGFLILMMLMVGKLVLRTRQTKKKTGVEALLGSGVRLEKDLLSQDTLLVRGELWETVHEEEELIPAGTEIEIVAKEGIRLRVRRRQPSSVNLT